MEFKIKKETVTIEEKTVEVTLKKSAKDICLMIGSLFVFAIQNDGTGTLYSGLENNNFSLQTDENGKLKMEKY